MPKNSKLSILIIENDQSHQRLLTEFLHASEIKINQIFTVNDLAKAINLIHEEEIDIILLNPSIGGTDGINTFKTIKKYTEKIPIVILSEVNDTQTALDAVKLGAQDYLIKGDFEKKLLKKTILYSIERLHNLNALHRSNERYNFISRATKDMVWDWNLLTGQVYRNKEGWKKIYKDEDNESEFTSQKDWYARIHPEDADKLKNIEEQLYGTTTEKYFKSELRVLRNDGQYAYVDVKGYIIRNDEGQPIRVIGTTTDIAEQKKVEEELKRLSLIAKETVNAVIITGPDEKIQWVNEAFTRLTEFEFDEVIGKTPGDFLQGKETDDHTRKYMNTCIANNKSFECAVINYTKSGRKRWIRIQGQPVFGKPGKLEYYFAMETDITEIKNAEEVLKASEEKYRYLFNNNPACIIIWELGTYRILEVNDAAIHQYGYSREEFLKLTILDVRLPEEYHKVKQLAENLKKSNAPKKIETRKHINKNKEEMYMSIASHKISYKGKPAVLALANNITEKVLLEEKLDEERVRKHREITEAVMIAQEKERQKIGSELHDNVNQILAGSRLYISILKKEIAKKHPLLEETDKLIYSCIQEIRNLSHSLVPPILNDSELIEALDNIIDMTTKSGELIVHKDLKGFDNNSISDKLKLAIYRIVQEQFNNIIKHAHAKKIKLKLQNKDKKVLLSIKDDGVGFDTSKRPAGVGLMNIRTRASLFKGEVKIISSPGKGCELKVNFM